MDKQESIYERHDVQGTPFTIIEQPNEEYTLTMGRYRFETYQTLHEAYENAEKISWDRILQVVTIIIKTQNETNFINELTKQP